MTIIDKVFDSRGTTFGTVIAIVLSMILAFAFVNVYAFAEAGSSNTSEKSSQTEQAKSVVSEVSKQKEEQKKQEPAATSSSKAATQKEAVKKNAELDEAAISLDLKNAYIVSKGQDIVPPADVVKVELQKDMRFEAVPDAGFNNVEVKTILDNDETVLEPEKDGTYLIKAAQISSRMTISVEGVNESSNSGTPEAGSSAPSDQSQTTEKAPEILDQNTTVESNTAESGQDTGDTVILGELQPGETRVVTTDFNKEVTVEEAPKVEADVSHPAYEGYAYLGSVIVKVTAGAGVLPEGTEVKASRVESTEVAAAVTAAAVTQGSEVQDLLAVDVTLVDKDGKDIQPNGAVNVCFFDADVSGDEVAVMRVSDDGSKVEEISTRQASANVQSFDTDHFTIYAISSFNYVMREDTYQALPGAEVEIASNKTANVNATWSVEKGGQNYISIVANSEWKATKSGSTWSGTRELMFETKKVTCYAGLTVKVANNTPNGDYVVAHGDEKFTIKVNSSKVYVAVYATDGLGANGMNRDMMDALGIGFKQNDGYFPVGVIELPTSFFTGKTSPYIKSQSDLQEVLTAISNVSTAELQNNGAKNKNNTVGSNLDKVQLDVNQNAGSQKTALFNWGGSENGSNIALKNNRYYQYHLDLRFMTNTLTFKTVQTDTNTIKDCGTRAYLTNTPTKNPEQSGDFYLNIPSGYQVTGYYTDQACTQPYTFGQLLTSNQTVYVKVEKKPVTITYNLNGGTSTTSQLVYNNVRVGDSVPTVNTPTRSGYDFAGWMDDQGTLYDTDDLPKTALRSATYTAQWLTAAASDSANTIYITKTFAGEEAAITAAQTGFAITVDGAEYPLSAASYDAGTHTYTWAMSVESGTVKVKETETQVEGYDLSVRVVNASGEEQVKGSDGYYNVTIEPDATIVEMYDWIHTAGTYGPLASGSANLVIIVANNGVSAVVPGRPLDLSEKLAVIDTIKDANLGGYGISDIEWKYGQKEYIIGSQGTTKIIFNDDGTVTLNENRGKAKGMLFAHYETSKADPGNIKFTNTYTKTPVPSIQITKSADPATNLKAGDTVTYTYSVKNTGETVLKDINVVDTMDGGRQVTWTAGSTIDTLAQNETKTLTATYTVVQADIDAGVVIKNSATATASDGTTDTTDTETEIDPEPARPEITVTKTATSTGDVNAAKAGDVITYTVTATNSGNVKLTGVLLTDPMAPAGTSLNKTSLEPNEATTATYTYTVTQADVDAGNAIVNTATVTAKDPQNKDITPGTATQTVTPSTAKSVSVVKALAEGQASTGLKAGDVVNYVITITNTGDVSLAAGDVVITDPLTGLNATNKNELAPNATETVETSYAITQTDVDKGEKVANVAYGKVSGQDIPTHSDPVTVDPTTAKSVSVVKTLAGGQSSSGLKAGDIVNYVITITNTGEVTLGIGTAEVTDPLTGLNTNNATAIAPNGTETFQTSYTITQTDVDAGEAIANVAYGKVPGQDEPTPSDPVEVTPSTTKSVSVAKALAEGQISSGLKAGDKVNYTITVTNNGDVTVSDVPVSDELTGQSWTTGTLAPNASQTFDAAYAITQADVDAGTQVVNVATATVPGSEPTPSNPVPVTPSTAKSVSVAKEVTSGKTTGLKAGEVVDYKITATNNGDVTVAAGMAVTDPLTGLSTATTKALAPGEYEEFTTSYTITQADVDAQAAIVNVATATIPGSEPTPSPDVPVTPSTTKAVTVAKAVTSGKTTGLKADEVVDYKITVTNSGDVTVSNIPVADALTGGSWTTGTLAPGASEEFTTSYTIIQADVDAGNPIVNVATATVPGSEPTLSPDVPVAPSTTKSVSVVKTITSGKATDLVAGDVVDYKIIVSNNGAMTLAAGMAVTDPLTGLSTATTKALAPGELEEFTTSYTITQADVDAGNPIVNIAYAQVPGSENPIPSEPVPVTPSTETGVAVVKTIASGKTAGLVAGDVVDYKITVTNASKISLAAGMAVTDPLTGLSTATTKALAPGEYEEFTTSYTITQADVDAGNPIVNIAYAQVPGAENPTPSPEVTVTPSTETSVNVVKALADGQASTGLVARDTVNYTITVTNNGDVTVSNIPVADALTGQSWTTGTLAPNASQTFDAQYTITQADVDAGNPIVNVATATIPGEQPTPSNPVPVAPSTAKSVSVAKALAEGQASTDLKAGDKVNYKVTVTNNGDVTVSSVPVSDELTGQSWTTGTLAPNASQTFDAQYTITQADVDKGEPIVNVATATVPGSEPTPSNPVPVAPSTAKSVSVAKALAEGQISSGLKAGDKVNYKITVTNNGDMTVNAIPVSDELTGQSWTTGELAPGAAQTFEAQYTITQVDVDAGKPVVNVATATIPGADPTPSPEVPVAPSTAKSVSVAKEVTSGKTTGLKAGEVVAYKITVNNNGDVTLAAGMAVTDPLTGLSTATTKALAPGELEEFTTSYTITQSDVDAGNPIVNIAYTQVPEAENPTPSPEVTVSPVEKAPGITVEKSATSTGSLDAAKAGDKITYTVTATNTGNVKLTGVTLADDKFPSAVLDKTSLDPGEAATATYEYTITQADIDAQAAIVNVATVDAVDPQGGAIAPATGSATVTPEPESPHMTISKTATSKPANGSRYLPGETITYEIEVTNDGNVTINNITVIDQLQGAVLDQSSIASIEPGKSATVTARYVVTEADGVAGKVTNVATATGNTSGPQTPEIPVTPGTNDQPTYPTPSPTPTPTPEPPSPTPTPTPEPPVPTPTPDNLPAPLDTIVPAMQHFAENFIGDTTTPTAQINDDGTPMTLQTVCWMHFYIILGLIATGIYGALVIARRFNHSNRLKKQDNDVMGKSTATSKAGPEARGRAKEPVR